MSLKGRQMFIRETNGSLSKTARRQNEIPRETKRMYRIPSIDRIRELKEEIAALVKLNALYKADSRRSELALQASLSRGLRLKEIREELGAMKRLGV